MTLTSEPESTTAAADPEEQTFQVALTFEDGITRFINCRPDQTVADASYRQRINIPLDCRDGACGTCKSFCESGEFDGGYYIDDALTDDEAEAGYALPCCMKPKSDLVLQIPATSDVAKTQAMRFESTVVDLERLSASTYRLAVEIPNRGDLGFLPGQYVNIEVPGTDDGEGNPISRSYSFANGPLEERLEFLIKLSPGGVMSTYLEERAKVGDALAFTGPNGSFFLRESDRPVLLLAGGTGLAPILSMLRKMETEGSRRKAHLIYGVSSNTDLVATEQIEYFQQRLPGFTWDHCISAPDAPETHRGYVMSRIAPEHLHDGEVAVYLCGPPPMVEAVRVHLNDSGVTPTGFYYEKFALATRADEKAPAAAAPAAETAESAAVVDDSPIIPAAPASAGIPSGAIAADLVVEDSRGITGQIVFDGQPPAPWTGPVPAIDDIRTRIAGQEVWPGAGSGGAPEPLDPDDDSLIVTDARDLTGQAVFPSDFGEQLHPSPPTPEVAPAVAAADPVVGSQGYVIGEEHPEITKSDSLFEAREALELGALELTFGRLTSSQLTGYRLLAEATLPFVSGDRFVDAAQYTETNAAFHDYLIAQTGNTHLLEAYHALGVKGRMSEVLEHATWCHPRCAIDHVEIVNAFESGDREAARALIAAHADRSKQTMRRAMADQQQSHRPRHISPGRFAGQVVVVTGAAQGIGAQTARRIGAEGGTLVLVDRSELVHELADELRGESSVLPVTADLEQYEGAADIVRQALDAYGRIDVLINNVGGAINFKPFTEFTEQEIRAEIDRSLLTTLYACRAVLPSMVEAGSGVIVNVSSAATRGIHRIPYSAAKGGVNAITASLAKEYAADNIRVVATAPGGTEAPPRRISRGTPEPRNDVEQQWFQAHIDQTLESSLMGRYGTLDEQAAAICFLASPEATYITGTVLPVAGGDLG